MSYHIDKIKGQKYAIHCPTQEIYKEIIPYIIKAGGRCPIESYKDLGAIFADTGEDTCLLTENIANRQNTIGYTSNYGKGSLTKVITAEEFLRDNEVIIECLYPIY